jgi:hypothetical protein
MSAARSGSRSPRRTRCCARKAARRAWLARRRESTCRGRGRVVLSRCHRSRAAGRRPARVRHRLAAAGPAGPHRGARARQRHAQPEADQRDRRRAHGRPGPDRRRLGACRLAPFGHHRADHRGHPFSDFDPTQAEQEAGASVRMFIVDHVRRCVDVRQLHGDATDIAHVVIALTQGLAAAETARRLGTSEESVDRRWELGVRALLDGLR